MLRGLSGKFVSSLLLLGALSSLDRIAMRGSRGTAATLPISAIPAVLLQDLESGYEVVEIDQPVSAGEAARFHRLLISHDP